MKLSTIRIRKGLTQNQLSERAGLSQSLISKLEKGQLYPDKVIQLKVENVLGPVDWISTKLQSIAAVQSEDEDASPEDRIIREIERYANNQPEAYDFILAYTIRRIRKQNISTLVDKAERHLRGEKVEFNDIEINTIKSIRNNKLN